MRHSQLAHFAASVPIAFCLTGRVHPKHVCQLCAKSGRGKARWQARPNRSSREADATGWRAFLWGWILNRGSANTSTRRSMEPCRDAQAYLSRTQRDRGVGVYFEPSWMSLDGYLDKGQAQVQGQLGTQMRRVGN